MIAVSWGLDRSARTIRDAIVPRTQIVGTALSIAMEVCEQRGVALHMVLAGRRMPQVMRARDEIATRIHRETGATYGEIASSLNYKDASGARRSVLRYQAQGNANNR